MRGCQPLSLSELVVDMHGLTGKLIRTLLVLSQSDFVLNMRTPRDRKTVGDATCPDPRRYIEQTSVPPEAPIIYTHAYR